MIVKLFCVYCDVCRLWFSPNGQVAGDQADVLDFRTERAAQRSAALRGWSTSGEADYCPGCVRRARGCKNVSEHIVTFREEPPTNWWHEALPCGGCGGALVWRPVIDEAP